MGPAKSSTSILPSGVEPTTTSKNTTGLWGCLKDAEICKCKVMKQRDTWGNVARKWQGVKDIVLFDLRLSFHSFTCDQVVVEPITQKPQMHRFEGRKMQYMNLEWRSAPVKTFWVFRFFWIEVCLFRALQSAHAHWDDIKIEACTHTDFKLKPQNGQIIS